MCRYLIGYTLRYYWVAGSFRIYLNIHVVVWLRRLCCTNVQYCSHVGNQCYKQISVCHKKSVTQRPWNILNWIQFTDLFSCIISTSTVNVSRFLSNLSEFGANNLIWVSRSQSQFIFSCTMLECLIVAFTAASSLHSSMHHWSWRIVWHWRTLQLTYCVHVTWWRHDDATTENGALKLFLNKCVLQADFAPRLQCGRFKVTYTPTAVQISAFRSRLLQLILFQ
jgi:hypothetical protein